MKIVIKSLFFSIEPFSRHQMVLPMSTFALAIGKWNSVQILAPKDDAR
jgi:hypothetical protein